MVKASLPDLDAFAAVARHRSFARAALERGVSRSAVSHAMRALEERLGVRLLNRTTRSVTPTEAGERLLLRLGPALASVAEALDEVNAFRDTPAGTLRLNVPRSATLLLGTYLGPFQDACPQVRIEIATDDGFVDIVRHGFDAGIRFGEDLAADMIAVPIGPQQRFAVVGSPGYVAGRGPPGEPLDLLGHACIGRRYPSGATYEWEFQKDSRCLRVAVTGSLILDDAELMLAAACAGLGLAYVDEGRSAAKIADGSLVRVLEDWCPAGAGFFLYYPSRRHVPAALRAFLDFVAVTNG